MAEGFQTYFNAVLGLCFVLGLIFLCAWISRRFGLSQNLTRHGMGRLQVVSRTQIDARHRLVLIRKDKREHLVLIGPNSSQVIESGDAKEETPDA